MNSQTFDPSIPGEYYLHGVMETASGFQINADSSFQFFFSQGALDRSGKGKWSEKDGYISFNSPAKPPLDFALISSKKLKNDSFTVRIVEQNRALLSYVMVYFKNGEKIEHESTNSDGIVSFYNQHPDEIILMFQFCPEKLSVFKLENKDHNYYEFRFEPWLFDIFLNDLKLKVEGNKLVGGNPMLEGNSYNYIKSRE